ncbi:MAG: hypothetical protein Q9213_007863 [Squamulea squamosa]
MAPGTVQWTMIYLVKVILLFSNLVGSYAISTPNWAISSNITCNITGTPDVADLVGTRYITQVRAASIPSLNRTYRYVHYPASLKAKKPTILLLPGFPSSSFDWRRQFQYFASRGYGIVAPDPLGFGGTDKPSDPEAYIYKKQALEVVGLLNCVIGTGKAIVVGHDLGALLLSRIANYFPARFEKYVFIDTGYSAPGHLPTKAVVEANKDVLGYQIFFNRDDSGSILDKHQSSVWSIAYTIDEPRYWPTNFLPPGTLEASLQADRRLPTGTFVSSQSLSRPSGLASVLHYELQDERIHNRIFAVNRGGYNPSLNQYRAIYRNLNFDDDKTIPDCVWILTKPVLLLTAANDPISTPAVAENSTRPFAQDLRVQQISAGHFLMLEKADEVNKAMNDFFEE